MSARERLRNGRRWFALALAAGFYPAVRAAEIFLSSVKRGSAIEAIARDAAGTRFPSA